MNLRTLSALLLTALAAHGAGVRISDLGLSTSPSDNTYLEIADLNASGTNKSAKILYTNLATVATVNAARLWTNSAGTVRLTTQNANDTLKLGADDGAGSGTIEAWTAGTKRWTISAAALSPESNYDVGTSGKPVQTLWLQGSTGIKLGDRRITLNTGSPEGVASDSVGSLYLRSDGASGTTLYTKVTGSGNTGWGALAPVDSPTFTGVVTAPSIVTPVLQIGTLVVSNLTTGWLYYNNGVTNAPYTPLSGIGPVLITNTAAADDALDLNQFTGATNAAIRAKIGGTQQWALYGDGADALGVRNGTNNQAFSVYKTSLDNANANYERVTLNYDSVNSSFLFAAAKAGSGTLRALSLDGASVNFKTAGSYRWNVTASGHLAPILDNTFTLGDATHRISTAYAFGYASYGTNALMVTSATGCTNTTAMNQIAYVTAATGASLTDAAGTTEFSGVTISAFTPIRLQPGGKFVGTSITYATGTSSHAW